MARAAPPPGDAAARFERLYRLCYQDLLGFALRRTDRPEAAADVVADTFVVAWRRIDQIPSDHPRAWLFGVARNVLYAHRRREAARAPTAPDPEDDVWGAADARLDAAALAPAMRAALGDLTAAERELLLLVAWEQLTPTEAAHRAQPRPTRPREPPCAEFPDRRRRTKS